MKRISYIGKVLHQRKFLAIALIVAMLGAILGAANFAMNKGLAQGETRVIIDPPSVTIPPLEPTTVDVLVQNVTDLYGAEFHIQFDPNILQVQDADPLISGIQIQPGTFLQAGWILNQVDNNTGRIDYAATQLNPTPPVSGSGVLATITFQGVNAGTSPVSFVQAILADRHGNEIPATLEDGEINVLYQYWFPLIMKDYTP